MVKRSQRTSKNYSHRRIQGRDRNEEVIYTGGPTRTNDITLVDGRFTSIEAFGWETGSIRKDSRFGYIRSRTICKRGNSRGSIEFGQ